MGTWLFEPVTQPQCFARGNQATRAAAGRAGPTASHPRVASYRLIREADVRLANRFRGQFRSRFQHS